MRSTIRKASAFVALLALGGASALFGCTAGEGGALIVEAPARIRQAAASDDAALCARLAVDITFDHRGDGAPPLLENEPLVPVADEPCSFTLPSSVERTFPRGEYDVLVRFLAGEGAFTGSESCAEQDVGPVWVGAYVVEGLQFPDQALRLSDDTFLSRPGDAGRVPVPGVSFDLDGDGRDNLAEVAAGSNPCVKNAPPVVDLRVEPSATDEEQPVTIRLSSSDPAGVRHRLTLRISHEHGPAAGTEVITYRRFTSAPLSESLSPDPDSGSLNERWSLAVEDASEEGTGSLALTLRFIPDEPFVGRLHLSATADDGAGTILAEATPTTLEVTDLDDPTRLLFEDEDGALVPLARIDFREVGPGVTPTERRFRIADDDLDDDVSQWTVALADGPAGMTLTKDISFWQLTWAPDNEDAVRPPAGGHTLLLQFHDGSGAPVGEPQAYPLGVAPLYNDPPALGDLSGLDLSLSAGPFSSKVLRFDFLDPDEAGGQPTCTFALEPVNDTPCDEDAWSEIRCEVDGTRDGARWPFLLTLTPSEAYFDECGPSPQFELALTITDVPPPGADPAEPKSVETTLELYTAEAVSVATVTGGPAAPGAISDLTELRIDGVRGVGALTAIDDTIGYTGRAVYVVDINASPPRFVRELPRTELCSFHEGYHRVPHAVAVDEVNGRLVGFGRAATSADNCYWDTELIVFSLSTEAPYDVVTWPKSEACGGSCTGASCGGAPAADSAGNVYLPCGGDSGTLLRIDGNNQLSRRDIDGYVMEQDTWGTDVVEAPDAKSWFVWPDRSGILFVDVGTWDDAMVTSTRLTLPSWANYRLEHGRADPWRKNYLYAYDGGSRGEDLELYRVNFDTGAPVQEGPLLLGDHGDSSTHGDLWVRFILKPVVPGQPAAEPDLVITGHINANQERFHVDLDSFTRVEAREPSDYWYLREVFESPDPRFYVGWVSSFSADYEGLKLFPWDPTLPFEVQSIPGTRGWRQHYMRDWFTSHSAGVAAISDSNGVIRVLRFENAP